MGGAIAVTVRRANGEEIRMCRWTNPLPGFFQNIRWVEADENHLDEYLKGWFEMREAYKRNPSDPETPMASCYVPFPFLAPHGYGLVVIDYQTKTVLTMQGYSEMLVLLFGQSQGQTVSELIEKGYVYVAPRDHLHICHQVTDIESLQALTREEFLKLIIFVRPDPWNFLHFPETVEGIREIRTAVLDLGFRLSEEEERIWEEFEEQWS